MTKDHVTINKDVWDADAPNYVASGERLWAEKTPEWGCWAAPEAELRLLPEDMTGQNAIELGCGTAYVSAWMARRGARVTGIDVSPDQLATARRLNAEHELDLTLIEGNAETTGLLDATFDFAISEYGAAIWCPPEIWLREAWRLLRPGGWLVFLGNHPLAVIATPLNGASCDFALHRPYKDFREADWTEVEIDPHGISFNLTFSDWLKLFAEIGFHVDRYEELYIPEDFTEAPARSCPPSGGTNIRWSRSGGWKRSKLCSRNYQAIRTTTISFRLPRNSTSPELHGW